MKIKVLELKNFGKFTEKKIETGDGIHVIYGENESGKSTVHSFIRGMLFGMERGRGRASVNDAYTRYEPWNNPNYYSGVLRFLCGGKCFRLERNFDKYSKKAVLICEDDGEELSVEDGDLEMLLEGLGAAVYDDTVSIGQMKAEASKHLSAELKNYATNFYASGSSEIDLAGALELLKEKKKQIDRDVKLSMQKKQENRERMEQEASYVWRDIHKLEENLAQIEDELSARGENAAKENQKEPENKGMIDEIRPEKWRVHPVEIILFLAVVISSFVWVARPWNSLVAIILALVSGIYIWNRMKDGKMKTKTPSEIILEEITPGEEKISLARLLWEQEHLIRELHEKQVEYENMKEQLAEFDELSEEYKGQDKKREALVLAEQRITELSGDMQGQLSIRLNQAASEIIEAVTGGAYTRLFVEEDLHMSLMANDRKVHIEQISSGAAEQVYFALRMAANSLIHQEEYPIILDDTFAYYDDDRLENTLRWLAGQNRQVIIFTCQKREKETLERLGIPYTSTLL